MYQHTIWALRLVVRFGEAFGQQDTKLRQCCNRPLKTVFDLRPKKRTLASTVQGSANGGLNKLLTLGLKSPQLLTLASFAGYG